MHSIVIFILLSTTCVIATGQCKASSILINPSCYFEKVRIVVGEVEESMRFPYDL